MPGIDEEMSKRVYILDGDNFSTLEEFWEEIGVVLMGIREAHWGRNLDAFRDVLYGGWGTPDEGFVLVWRNSGLSRKRLGYPETVRQLEKRLQTCHPTAREITESEIEIVKEKKGATVFDWLVEIIREEDRVELRLE
jgi:RNAse (barnase) inhibitor barstar